VFNQNSMRGAEYANALPADDFLWLDLQWFAAEDEGRTEEPTETRLRKAREEEGRVAKSQELVGAVGLLLPALGILFLAPYMLRTFLEMLQFFLTDAIEMNPVNDRRIFVAFIIFFAKLALPVLVIAFLAAIGSNIAQVGFLWTTKPLSFKFERVIPNFAQYFSKTIFSMNGLFNLFKSIIKMAFVGLTAYFLIEGDISKIMSLNSVNFYDAWTLIAVCAVKLLIFVAILLVILSIPDYMFQRWQFIESLKMQPQEVKEELKQEYGDPQIKAHLRRRMRELLTQNIAVNVPKADVVITNPTHFAVALEYNASLYGPRVLAKGEDDLALRIKRIAAENSVPVVENKPLARALYATVEIGEIVPEQYWNIIVEILIRVKSADELNRMSAGGGL